MQAKLAWFPHAAGTSKASLSSPLLLLLLRLRLGAFPTQGKSGSEFSDIHFLVVKGKEYLTEFHLSLFSVYPSLFFKKKISPSEVGLRWSEFSYPSIERVFKKLEAILI